MEQVAETEVARHLELEEKVTDKILYMTLERFPHGVTAQPLVP